MSFFDALRENSHFISLGLFVFCILLFVLCIVALCGVSKLKKRINKFMGENNSGDFESLLNGFVEESKEIDQRQERVLNDIKMIREQIKFCIQKVGIVRYNPFEDVGGDLCYAIAVLDENNDGFVLNSVYSRDGCYNYAKPIEKGKCVKYKLSAEEERAIDEAMRKDGD